MGGETTAPSDGRGDASTPTQPSQRRQKAPISGGDVSKPTNPSQGRQNAPINEERIRRGMEGAGATPQQIERALAKARKEAAEQPSRLITDDFGNLVKVPSGEVRPSTPTQSPKTQGQNPSGGGEATKQPHRLVTDDNSNQQKVPIEQAKPGAPAKPAQASKPGGKGAKKGLRGILDKLPKIAPSIGVTSQKTYIAQHSLDKSDAKTHGVDENARLAHEYSITGARNVNNSETQQSAQQDRLGRDASRNNVDERSNVRDVSSRADYSVTDKAGRSKSDSFAIQRDLTADPHFLEKVAQRNGMTAARFAGQEEGRQWQMIIDYAAEKGAMQASTTMPSSSFAGAKIPLTSTDLRQIKEEEESKLPDNIDEIHRKNVQRTGFRGVDPVKTDTTLPAIATANEALVKAQLDPTVPGSIPERAAAFDENVRAWASADKPVGEGRANTLGVVEGMAVRDVKDYFRKGWDKLTGGDGTADGEKLNDNMKGETSSPLPINRANSRPK
jgi:conjugal transfer mating pair stabilization protein TraG